MTLPHILKNNCIHCVSRLLMISGHKKIWLTSKKMLTHTFKANFIYMVVWVHVTNSFLFKYSLVTGLRAYNFKALLNKYFIYLQFLAQSISRNDVGLNDTDCSIKSPIDINTAEVITFPVNTCLRYNAPKLVNPLTSFAFIPIILQFFFQFFFY